MSPSARRHRPRQDASTGPPMRRKGRMPLGMRHGIVPTEQAIELHRRNLNGESIKAIANASGLKYWEVERMVRNVARFLNGELR